MNEETNTVDITKTEQYKAIKSKIKAFYDTAIANKTKFVKPTEAEKAAIASLTEAEKAIIQDKHQNMRLPCFTYGLGSDGIICNRSQAAIVARGPNSGTGSGKLGENEKRIEQYTKDGIWSFLAPEKKAEIEAAALVEKTAREAASIPASKRNLEKTIEGCTTETQRADLYNALIALVEEYTLTEIVNMSTEKYKHAIGDILNPDAALTRAEHAARFADSTGMPQA